MNKYIVKTMIEDNIKIEADYYNQDGKYIHFYKIEGKRNDHNAVATIYKPLSVIKSEKP